MIVFNPFSHLLPRTFFGTVTVRTPSADMDEDTVSSLKRPGNENRRQKVFFETAPSCRFSTLPSITSSLSSTTFTLMSPSMKSRTSITTWKDRGHYCIFNEFIYTSNMQQMMTRMFHRKINNYCGSHLPDATCCLG